MRSTFNHIWTFNVLMRWTWVQCINLIGSPPVSCIMQLSVKFMKFGMFHVFISFHTSVSTNRITLHRGTFIWVPCVCVEATCVFSSERDHLIPKCICFTRTVTRQAESAILVYVWVNASCIRHQPPAGAACIFEKLFSGCDMNGLCHVFDMIVDQQPIIC